MKKYHFDNVFSDLPEHIQQMYKDMYHDIMLTISSLWACSITCMGMYACIAIALADKTSIDIVQGH